VTASDTRGAIDAVWRIEAPRLIAGITRIVRDVGLAEDLAQDALVAALEQWPGSGVPDNPGAWLMATAKHRAIDRLRRDQRLERKQEQLGYLLEAEERMAATDLDSGSNDDLLRLIFMSSHPVLSTDARVALTLRLLGGLTTDEIARAFLVAPEAMKRRLSRAKAKITTAGIPFTVPPGHLLPERLAAVLAVVYLIFNEGYGGRGELASEAIRLGQVLVALMPDEPEAHGLLALMLLHDARRHARFTTADELVLLCDQDRTLWDSSAMEQGRAALERARALGGRGPYVLQAAIASLQTEPEIDWPQIAELYGELGGLTRSPVVELNRAVAVAESEGPGSALAIVERLDLSDYQYWHSTRAELLRRLGRADEARGAYRSALELARAAPERDFLRRRLREL
jgi:RNA polymerase sigma-70 factor, ECF subfamily